MKPLFPILVLIITFSIVFGGTKQNESQQKEKVLFVEFFEHEADKKIDVII